MNHFVPCKAQCTLVCAATLLSFVVEVDAQTSSTNRVSDRSARTKARYAASVAPGATPPKAVYLLPEPDIIETMIWPNPNAAGDTKELQSRVAKLLSRFDEPYAERALHFSWLQNDPYFQQIRGRVSGWAGIVKDVEQLPGDGWVATVRVSPRIYPQSRAILLDYVEETYRFQNGKLARIASDAIEKKRDKRQIFTPF